MRPTITCWDRGIVFHTISPSQQPSGRWRESRWVTAPRWAACTWESLSTRLGPLPLKVLLPLADREVLEQAHSGVELDGRGPEVGLVADLLRLDGLAGLAQQRTHGQEGAEAHRQRHQRPGHPCVQQWDTEG